jgi:hypothetical protein
MYSLNFLEFLSKNLFWYAMFSLVFNSLDITTWGLFDGFFSILSVIIFELILFGSCLTEINE